MNELLNDEELSKKLGRMETILNYYEAKLKNEFNERKNLEEKIETLTNDLFHLQENDVNLSLKKKQLLFLHVHQILQNKINLAFYLKLVLYSENLPFPDDDLN